MVWSVCVKENHLVKWKRWCLTLKSYSTGVPISSIDVMALSPLRLFPSDTWEGLASLITFRQISYLNLLLKTFTATEMCKVYSGSSMSWRQPIISEDNATWNTTRTTPTHILASLAQKPLWPVPQLVVWSAHSSCIMETLFIHYHVRPDQYLSPLPP